MLGDASTPISARLALRRRFGWQIASIAEIGGMSVILVAILASDHEIALWSKLLASIFPLFFIAVGIVTFFLFPLPVVVEVDVRGVRRYRSNRLRLDLPWSEVRWVAAGVWSVGVYTVATRKRAQCILVRGPGPRHSIGLDNVTYALARDAVVAFSDAAVHHARLRGIPILERPSL